MIQRLQVRLLEHVVLYQVGQLKVTRPCHFT